MNALDYLIRQNDQISNSMPECDNINTDGQDDEWGMVESSLSKLDDKGVFTIVKVENVEKKIGKETITELNIETGEEFDGVKNFYTSRKKMIVAKFYDDGKPTQLAQDIQRGKKYRVKIIKQRFGNGREDFDIAKS